MSATPIPRTLAIAIYGDLRTSFIKELPKDRKPVKTEIVRKNNKEKVYRFIKKELNNNHQAFVICPLIEDNNEAVEEKASLRKEYNKLKKGPFKDFKINYLHGQMSSEEKRKVMREFREKRFDILVSTSVVEIGLDIPGATVMLIEGAEQFGLSQLHQFRGRVGRNNHQAYCFLAPRKTTDKINKRLKVISSTNDGFKIAREDLKLRGPGEILGERQHGKIDLKLASFFDFRLIKTARKVADRLLKESPRLDKYKALKNRIKQLELKAHIE
jgi:ATP-dependent DNA helicase RecG